MVTKPTGGFAKPPSPAERAARLDAPGATAFVEGGTPPVASTAPVQSPMPVTASTKNYPWIGKPSEYTKQKPFRIPENEAFMLEYVAGTTFGENAQSIELAGVRYMIKLLLTEKGFTVEQDSKTGALTVVGYPD